MKNILIIFIFLQLTSIFLTGSKAQAIPAFARKENVSCIVCHMPVPRLTRLGYEYRNAGYRWADKIGEEQNPKSLAEAMSARVNISADYQHQPNLSSANSQPSKDQETETATGGSIYPLAGSFAEHFGSLVEIGINSTTEKGVGLTTKYSGTQAVNVTVGPQVTVSDLQLRGAWGDADQHFSARIGQLPLIEGYGAMDRVLGSSVSLSPVVSATATGGWGGAGIGTSAGSSPGLEVGYTWGALDVAVGSLNGLVYDQFDKSLHPYGNGYPGRDPTDPNYNNRDTYFSFNYFLGQKNAVSGYYYTGTVSLPLTNGDQTGFAAGNYFQDSYKRASLYGSVFPLDNLGVFAGYLVAVDALPDPIFAGGGNVNASGYFIEVMYGDSETSAVGARFTSMNQSSDSGWLETQGDLYYTRFWKYGLYYKVDLSLTDQQQSPTVSDAVVDKILFQISYIL